MVGVFSYAMKRQPICAVAVVGYGVIWRRIAIN